MYQHELLVLRARLVVRGFANLDNRKTRVTASNRNNEKLKVWAKCNVMVACLVTHCKMPRMVIATVSLGMSGIQLHREVYFSTRYKLAYSE